MRFLSALKIYCDDTNYPHAKKQRIKNISSFTDQSFIMYTMLPIIIIPIAENGSIVESGLHGVEYIITIEIRIINSGIHPTAFFSVFLAFISLSVSDHLSAC